MPIISDEGTKTCYCKKWLQNNTIMFLDCNNAYAGQIFDSIICAGEEGKDACQVLETF